MSEAFIVGAVRSAIGKKSSSREAGVFANTRADDLLARVLQGLVARTGVDPGAIEDVIAGCVTQVGEQGFNIARVAALTAGFPESVCGTTVNRMCGSSQQAVNFAAMAVMSGQHDLVIAAGVEVMNRTPMGSDGMLGANPWFPGPEAYQSRYGAFIPQGESAEMICDRWGFTREQCDAYALQSQQRAARAVEQGYFDREILPIEVVDAQGHRRVANRDEGVRPDTTLEKLAALKPAFRPDGRMTAGNSSQISDGAAAVLLASKAAVDRYRLTPRARIVATALAGDDPRIMLTAPIPATRKVLARAGLSIHQIDVVEINEAFASVVLAWAHEIKPDMAKVNPNGGAIALGHPLGATGARLVTSCLHELERTGGRYGLVTMCIGFGQATATILERL